jgi:hypothetical protein
MVINGKSLLNGFDFALVNGSQRHHGLGYQGLSISPLIKNL